MKLIRSMGLQKKNVNNIIEINKRKMKTKIILFIVAAILLIGIVFNCKNAMLCLRGIHLYSWGNQA